MSRAESLPFCPACAAGRQTRSSVPSVRVNRALTPFQVVWVDLMFVRIPSVKWGSRVSIVFVDDNTRYATRYFLQDKRADTCADALLRFLNTVVRPSGYRLGGCTQIAVQSSMDSLSNFVQTTRYAYVVRYPIVMKRMVWQNVLTARTRRWPELCSYMRIVPSVIGTLP